MIRVTTFAVHATAVITRYNQSTDSTDGSSALSVVWENGPERGRNTVLFNR